MSKNLLASEIANPYACALFNYSAEKNIMHHITIDFQSLKIFLEENKELTNYLNNPIVSSDAKSKILTKILKSELNNETFRFLMVLISKDRINLLPFIIQRYIDLVYDAALVIRLEVLTAYPFDNFQKNALVQKLKDMTDAREVLLKITLDRGLIGGFLMKSESKVLDFTIKNQFQTLAKHLDTILEI